MVNSQEPSSINWRVLIPVGLLFIAIIIAIIFFTLPGQQGQFRPQFVPNPPSGFINGTPLEITFSELDANPAVYQNKLVRVSGNYTRLSPVVCVPYKGPRPRWGLISEGFQMDVVGIDEILTLAPEGAPLVVDGVWRLYNGPLGCGKEPDRATLWYLEVRRIVEPNPLQFSMPPEREVQENTAPITATTTITATPTVPNTAAGTMTPTPTPSPTPSPSPTILSSPTGTINAITPTPTTGTVNSVTATPRPGNGSGATATPGGSASGTGTPTLTPTANATGGTPDPTTEALATSPSGTITAPTLQPTQPPGSYGGGGYP